MTRTIGFKWKENGEYHGFWFNLPDFIPTPFEVIINVDHYKQIELITKDTKLKELITPPPAEMKYTKEWYEIYNVTAQERELRLREQRATEEAQRIKKIEKLEKANSRKRKKITSNMNDNLSKIEELQEAKT